MAPVRQSKRKRSPLGGGACKTPPHPATAISTAAATEVDGEPQLVAQYPSDIYTYLRSMEIEPTKRPLANYMEEVQTDVTANMRGILVNWLVGVVGVYKLSSDTLYLTISYIDRFLSFKALNREKVPLLGLSAMRIASKYEEISPPNVEDLCSLTNNTYTKDEVVQMERDLMKYLNFEMGNPTINTFLRRFIRSSKKDYKTLYPQLESLANYLAELSLLDYGCIRFVPSLVAASAIFLARFTVNPNTHPWGLGMQLETGYSPSELKDCICIISDLQLSRNGSAFTITREKYKQHKFNSVAMLRPPTEIPAPYFESFNQ